MDLPEARLIARHHLGEHLRDVIPVGSGYNVLIHLGDGGYRALSPRRQKTCPPCVRRPQPSSVLPGGCPPMRGWSGNHGQPERR